LLRVRWLGTVGYADAHALQRAMMTRSDEEYLLLLEHPHVYTGGVNADASHVLVDLTQVGASMVRTDRGGDVTYHGPGQLVGYPLLNVPVRPGSTHAHVHDLEQLIIDVLDGFGLPAGRMPEHRGVWVDAQGPRPRKICAVGVRMSRGRSMHGFALNVRPDLAMFDHIVPCGISDKGVTSMLAEGVDVSMREVVDAVVDQAERRWGPGLERADAAWRVAPSDLSAFTRSAGTRSASTGGRLELRLAEAGVAPGTGISVTQRKPAWLRVNAEMGPEFRDLKRTMRSLDLVTVCEEAGCPNIFECWADGTATFMINGERCTRACGFCLVDTRKPAALDPGEPERVAQAVERMGLAHAVVTAVARDDLLDGGARAFAATIEAIRERCPATSVEVLIPDCKGRPEALEAIFAARPDVLNHNVETVVRLQRAVRPSASYARSLAVLARAASAGLRTKSGLILGMGEVEEEVVATLTDLRAVGVDIVTIGQYLRPTAAHLPVARWWRPEEIASLGEVARAMGFGHVEASPLTRSSYHARQAVAGVGALT
jgi:lipoic acid synthetase